MDGIRQWRIIPVEEFRLGLLRLAAKLVNHIALMAVRWRHPAAMRFMEHLRRYFGDRNRGVA